MKPDHDPQDATLGESATIRVRGTVQGVGFRPSVWRLANEEGLVGEVRNEGGGVRIEIGGGAEAMARFLARLEREVPPLARIEALEVERSSASLAMSEFRIVASEPGRAWARIAADAAICAACSQELFDPDDRRFHYPFGNCTNCGPRFSIVTGVPFDRVNTTMAGFGLCAECQAEYDDPADRRFHAQAIACPKCGPRVWLEALMIPTGAPQALARGGEAIEAAAQALLAGKIVAIRGLGGFHLACDASNPDAIDRLRVGKRRDAKPLAIMASDAAMVRRYCTMSPIEQALFESVEAPIVVLPRRAALETASLPEELAPGLDELAFMRPYTPLHLLLMRRVARPLVMTSGNLSDEPQVASLADARARLAGIAELALMHDRDIANRIDDSLVRVMAGRPRMLRRARGYAPGAIELPAGLADASVLAFGAQQKTTFAIAHTGAALLAQHQGDLDEPETFDDYERNLALFAAMTDHRPRVLAADLHPDYLSTKLARARAQAWGLPLIEVQHHHAHIAGCMAEHRVALDAPPLLGVALDGLGMGSEGALWGGEFLLADYRGFRRLASLSPVALPGGAQAAREPWRNLWAQLERIGSWPKVAGEFADKPVAGLERMLAAKLASPLASSCGRLFDAVAALLGLCRDRVGYSGQAAMALESLAARELSESTRPGREFDRESAYAFAIVDDPGAGLQRLDPAPMWRALLDERARGIAPSTLALRFHLGLARGVVAMIAALAERERFDTVALSGGCFLNRILLEAVEAGVLALGLHCLSNIRTPAHDGGLALGQLLVAAATHEHPRA